ncbi:MAG: hypothetical protein IRZ01_03715 [Thermoflavifilum aggregans]|nr:hypothetical protein [Thermoflavifilum aggregans]
MQKIITISFLLIALQACSKIDDHFAVPQQPTVQTETTPISQFTGYAQGNTVHLSFTYTGDLSQVAAFRIYSGTNSYQLCAIGELQITTNSTHFEFVDNNPKGDPTYYLIGILGQNGQITYANIILPVHLHAQHS